MSEREINLNEVAAALTALDSALCNFLNAVGDPFTPVKEWDAETKRNLTRLSNAYDRCHRVKAMSLGEVPPFLAVEIQREKSTENTS